MIKFMPQGTSVEVKKESSILELAQKAGVGIRAECGGRGGGSCRVMVEPACSFSSPSDREKAILGVELGKGLRLACQTKVLAAGTVFIPPGSRPEQVIVLEESFGGTDIELKTAVRQLFLQVPKPTLEDPTADGQLLLQVLQQHTEKRPVAVELANLKRLSYVLREEKGQVTAIVWQNKKLLDLIPGNHSAVLGVAVDLGTTTMVVYLFNIRSGELLGRASGLNMQTAYGADEITRIHYATRESIGGDPPLGICGTGLISAVAALRETGILEASGRFNARFKNPRLRSLNLRSGNNEKMAL